MSCIYVGCDRPAQRIPKRLFEPFGVLADPKLDACVPHTRSVIYFLRDLFDNRGEAFERLFNSRGPSSLALLSVCLGVVENNFEATVEKLTSRAIPMQQLDYIRASLDAGDYPPELQDRIRAVLDRLSDRLPSIPGPSVSPSIVAAMVAAAEAEGKTEP